MENIPPGQTNPQSGASRGFLETIEDELFKFYQKVPWHLPPGVREFIVHYGPWITLVIMVIAIPAILLALGLSAIFSSFAMMNGARVGGLFFVSGLISLASLVLEAIALPGLFKRQMAGWKFLFYSILLSAVANLIAMNWGGLILGTVLSLYVLFEVKSYYK